VGRDREYSSDAERQRAYRQRKKEALRRERQQRQGQGPQQRPPGRAGKRALVSEKLVKVLGMLGSAHVGERDNAAVKASQILKEADLTWYDVLAVEKK
jgi:hypothetical protein